MGCVKYLISSSLIICVPILLYLSQVQEGHTASLIVCLALLGFFAYAPHPVLHGWLQRRFPKEVMGFAFGFSNGFGQFGSFVAPLSMGFLVVRTPDGVIFGNAFIFLGVICFVGAILASLLSEKEYDVSAKFSSL